MFDFSITEVMTPIRTKGWRVDMAEWGMRNVVPLLENLLGSLKNVTERRAL